MRRVLAALVLPAVMGAVMPAPASATPLSFMSQAAGTICRQAVAAAERSAGIPAQLLAAIARVESGRRDPVTGRMGPWPWTINAEGIGHFYETEAEAIAAVRDLQARGVHSIDVGCMQVNLMHHPDAFGSLEQAFDPFANAAYAARFLSQLKAQTGNWEQAAAAYHSQTPEIGADYQRQVMAVWPEEIEAAAANPPSGMLTGGRFFPPGPGAIMLSNGADRARIIPLQPVAGGSLPPARGLAAYRRAPISLAARMPARSGS
jgi:hypothetical protein